MWISISYIIVHTVHHRCHYMTIPLFLIICIGFLFLFVFIFWIILCLEKLFSCNLIIGFKNEDIFCRKNPLCQVIVVRFRKMVVKQQHLHQSQNVLVPGLETKVTWLVWNKMGEVWLTLGTKPVIQLRKWVMTLGFTLDAISDLLNECCVHVNLRSTLTSSFLGTLTLLKNRVCGTALSVQVICASLPDTQGCLELLDRVWRSLNNCQYNDKVGKSTAAGAVNTDFQIFFFQWSGMTYLLC